MRITAVIGYTVAIITIPLTMATFMGMNFFSHQLVEITGLKVSPWSTGGEVVKTIEHGQYRTLLHRPVFDGLFTKKSEGFIQIDWEPGSSLPATIVEDVDYNGDGIIDFQVAYNTQTNTAQLTADNSAVISLQGSYILKERRAVRVNLYNQEK